jgi:hypothetical protein
MNRRKTDPQYTFSDLLMDRTAEIEEEAERDLAHSIILGIVVALSAFVLLGEPIAYVIALLH